jgi:multidrug efflux pump subunit AcrA (membrane-fusion protein)
MLKKLNVHLAAALLGAWSAFASMSPEEAANTIVLDDIGVKNLRIETVEVEETEFEETIFALGRIHVAPGRRAIVSSRVPGRVVSVEAHIDTRIRMASEALTLEARQPGDPPPRIRIPAPIDGLVSKVNIVEGQPVEQTDSLVEILDLSSVHATAAVPEHLASRLREGMTARIRVLAAGEREFTAKLAHIGAEVDRESGVIEAVFHVANEDYVLRPGMRAEFSIAANQRGGVLSIPRASLQGGPSNRFIYRRHYDAALKNAFVRIPVITGAMNERAVEITAGLTAGDEVVTHGAYALGFAGKGNVSLKEALDAAHGHPHNEDGSEMTAEQQTAAKGGATSREPAHGFTPLATFFASTTALLSILLVVLGVKLGRHTAA